MASRRLVFILGLAAALAIGVGLRLSTRKQLNAGGRARPLSSDDNYHLRRARFAAAHYPRTIVFDPLMNFPQGGVAIWPPLFDVALATPARLLHGAKASPDEIERGALWVPVAFAAGAILLAGLLGELVAGPTAGVALALFVAISPGHILWTQYGHTDQHVAESFFGLLVLWLFLRSREDVALSPPADGGERGQLFAEVLTGVALALAVLAWQGAIFWGAIIALSLFLEAVAHAPERLSAGAPDPRASRPLLAAPATAWWLGATATPLTYISFGYFQPLFLGALAGGTILLDTALRAARGQLQRRETLWRAAVLGLAAAAVLPFAGSLLSGLARGVGYVAGRTSEVVRGHRLHLLPEELALGNLRGAAASGRRDRAAGQAALRRLLPLASGRSWSGPRARREENGPGSTSGSPSGER